MIRLRSGRSKKKLYTKIGQVFFYNFFDTWYQDLTFYSTTGKEIVGYTKNYNCM